MSEKEFLPEQFARRSGIAQEDTELRKWLRSCPVNARMAFINELFGHNYRYAISLVRSSQLPIEDVMQLLRAWLLLGKHNCSSGLIQGLIPVLGERRFWETAAKLELTEAMSDFLNYHSHGKLRQYVVATTPLS
jgi:hypothetical protein